MTYFRFHLLFNLPVSLLLLAGLRGLTAGEGTAALLVLVAVVAFTSPWDNAAVRRGIWDFPPGKYWRRIRFLPVEEYLFFVWQSVNVMASVSWLLRALPRLRSGAETPIAAGNLAALALLAALWIGIGVGLARRKPAPRWNYARHLLYWFLPVVAAQWALAPALFAALLPVLALVTAAWGTYYTAADLIAVRAGVWYFDPKQITGHRLGGILPWEEIAFFYLTSLLVAQSYLLLLPAAVR